jgi:intracellular sulfur oxidation DsrE/DsrF family protein
MKSTAFVLTTFLLLAGAPGAAAIAASPVDGAGDIRVDVPVVLEKADVVFNMDHSAFVGDTPIGLKQMQLMVDRLKRAGTKWHMVAIFHGAAGYMLLNDHAYNAARMTTNGNPYKAAIANLLGEGVLVEECAVTMKGNKWTNADLLPGVKVNAGANLRIVQLVQQGYVVLQP